mmetsp:Transcript_17736/g.16013  ORF Transcript_17736/g.16013 Transcript_17736/m.16013 type:complete len:90 (-) Transcript_17736:961-1230(-)
MFNSGIKSNSKSNRYNNIYALIGAFVVSSSLDQNEENGKQSSRNRANVILPDIVTLLTPPIKILKINNQSKKFPILNPVDNRKTLIIGS